MKKKEKYYAVNNQEDEDGYTLYPGKAIIDENVKRQDKSSPDHTATTATGSQKQQPRHLILSPSPMPGK